MRKNTHFLVFFLVFTVFLIAFTGCTGPVASKKIVASQIPPYGKVLNFDWSGLSEGQKQEYFKSQEPFIYKLLSLGVVEEKDVLDPSRKITRKEFIRWLVKSIGIPLVKSGIKFKDVTRNMPEYEYIMTALSRGIIEPGDTFLPEEPLLRSDAAIWLINARGESAKKEASKILEPIIPAQDGYDEVPKNAIGAMTLCMMPEYQLLQYRWTTIDEFRYIRPNDPMLVIEAAYSIYMVNYPPVRGNSIVIGQAAEPSSLFFGLDQMGATGNIISLLYGSAILSSDEFGCVSPYLIKKIPTQENGLWKIKKRKDKDGKEKTTMEVTFELRQRLKWADGSEITGDDIVFYHYLYNHPSFATVHTEMDRWIDEVRLDPNNPYRVTVFWNTPTLFIENIGLMPRTYFEKEFNYHLEKYDLSDKNYYDPSKDDPKTEKVDESYKSKKYLEDEIFVQQCTTSDVKNKIDYNKRPMHAGAYKVKKWELGQSIILEPNENYIFGRPLLDSITFVSVENTDTLVTAAMAGNIEMILNGSITTDQGKKLEKADTGCPLKVIYHPAYARENLELNVDDPTLSDVRVRKALYHGIDRQGLIDHLLEGKAQIAHSWHFPMNKAYDETLYPKYEYSKEKADKLLNSAGWIVNPKTGKREKNGKIFSITIMTTAGNKLREQVQAVIESGWKELGLEVKSENEDATSFFATTLRERKFKGPTATLFAWYSGLDNGPFPQAMSSQIPTEANDKNGLNYTAYQNKVVDQLSSESLEELNKKIIIANDKQIQTILMEELPMLPLFFRVDVSACPQALVNYHPRIDTNNAEFWYWNK